MMREIVRNLWCNPQYFQKSIVAACILAAVVLPQLPLGEMGPVGYWIGKALLPLAVVVAARSRQGSGLTTDEAAKLRALIPTQAKIDEHAPKGL
jgi:hypothetical protein